MAEFLRQCWRELGKVGWSSPRSVAQNSVIVFLVVTLLILTISAMEAAGWLLGRGVSG